MKKLSIIVPVYFNEESLLPLFKILQEVEGRLINEEKMALELIFIDDGSGDDSFKRLKEIKEFRPETKLVKLTRNFGAVHASKCGMQFVTGDCFIVVAADLQDPPEVIFEMLLHWKAGAKFVIAARISRDDPLITKLFAALYYWILRKLVLRDYPKGGYDLALMDRDLLSALANSSKNLYTPILAYWLGFKPVVIPYHRRKREHGRSRWTFSKKLNAFLDIVLGFSAKPIRLISLIGAGVSIISFMYGISVILHALLGSIPVPGFASIVALITFLLGLIILMLGVIGEYLWRVFDESNKRPEVVIESIF